MAKGGNKKHGFRPGQLRNRDNPDKLQKEARSLSTLYMAGEHVEVERRVRSLLDGNPLWGFGWKLLAGVLSMLSREEEALAASNMAIRYLGGDAEVYSNHGNILKDLGRATEAVEAYRRAIKLRPDFAIAYNNLGNVLKNQGEMAAAIEAYQGALRIKPDFIQAYDNLLFAQFYLSARDNAAILELHRKWDEILGIPLNSKPGTYPNDRDVERVLNIGYVSPDLARHPVGIFMLAVLKNHDRSRFRVFCYSDRANEDEISASLREQCDCWRRVVGLSHRDVAAMVQKDGIDILVDLAGHTSGNRLPVFALRPAPVQATWIGYPGTTGLRGIDHILMDDTALLPGEERFFSEKVVYLPETRFCYTPPACAPPVAALPCLDQRGITFGSFNNLAKVTEEVMALWAKILLQVPGSRLLLKSNPLESGEVREKIASFFESRGVERERLLLRPGSPYEQMLSEYADMDIALDPFPFTGGLTSCEALWMGVPVITLYGDKPIARQTAGFLKTIGLGSLVAANEAGYLELAVKSANDRDKLKDIRAGLRERMASSLLCDGARFTANLEQAYRAMWETWCHI